MRPLQARNRRSKLRMDRVDPSAPGTKNSEQPNGQIEEKKKRKKKKQKTTCSATQLCTLRVSVFAAKGESILSRLAIASNFPVTTAGLEQSILYQTNHRISPRPSIPSLCILISFIRGFSPLQTPRGRGMMIFVPTAWRSIPPIDAISQSFGHLRRSGA
jgi:hypothetical protein